MSALVRMRASNGSNEHCKVYLDIQLERSAVIPAIHAEARPEDDVIHKAHVRVPSRLRLT